MSKAFGGSTRSTNRRIDSLARERDSIGRILVQAELHGVRQEIESVRQSLEQIEELLCGTRN
ncbi:MAG: hypothetical protein MKZ52_01055 [Candidatus Thalassarchaeum sp.]|nr:hypothetical protein [Candidatus Thalassarchaeum sp.]